jgi:hypothetical protein
MVTGSLTFSFSAFQPKIGDGARQPCWQSFFLLQAGQSFVGLAGASINILNNIFSNVTARCWFESFLSIWLASKQNNSMKKSGL